MVSNSVQNSKTSDPNESPTILLPWKIILTEYGTRIVFTEAGVLRSVAMTRLSRKNSGNRYDTKSDKCLDI
jgi:hypothetical protein